MNVDFVQCRHCGEDWTPGVPKAFARHERGCALRVACPHCGASIREPCRYPSGAVSQSNHSRRERLAERA